MMSDRRPLTRSGTPTDATAPFQFGLRTLLLWVAAVGVLFAVLRMVGAIWQAVIVWFLVLVAVHVAANLRGSRVGPRRRNANTDAGGPAREPTAPSIISPCFAETTRLGGTARLGRAPVAMTLVGLLAGGSTGTALFAWFAWERSGYAGVFVAGVSSAVVGAFLGFLSSSFLQTAFQALREAADAVHPSGVARPQDTTFGNDEIGRAHV